MSLSTKVATNYKMALWGALPILVGVLDKLSPGWMQWSAFIVFCFAMAYVNGKTEGSGITPEQGEAIKEAVLNPSDDAVEAALEAARK